MKKDKAKFLLLAITGAALGAALVACGGDHEHEYGKWSITTQPTLEQGGVATRNCVDGDDPQTFDLPALSNETFWTKSGSGSHAQGGSFTYTSEYGTVTITVAPGEGSHVWSEWIFDEEPTETKAGSAHRSCDCDTPDETLALPALSDASFWTKEETPADYVNEGTIVYKNTEHNVTYTVTLEKIPAPYSSQTYFGILFDYTEDSYKNRTKGMESSWLNQHVALDKDGYTDEGASIFGYNARPFRIQLTDAAKGTVKTVVTDSDGTNKEIAGYIDMESGIFVVPRNGRWDYPAIGTPFETDATRSDSAASSCWTVGTDFAIAVKYTAPDETVHTIFIHNDSVYFNVSFVDGEGNEIAAEACYSAERLYVKQGDNVLYSFGYGDGAMHELDGVEGAYSGTLPDLGEVQITLTGFGVVKADSMEDGAYEAIEGGKYAVYISGAYYEVTFDFVNKTFSATKPMAHIVYDLQNEELTAIDAVDKNINIAYALPEPGATETATAVFKGWYLNAACTQEAATPFVPTADVTLYAKWAAKKTVTVHSTYNSSATESITVAVGDNVKEFLEAQYNLDLDDMNRVYFDGWFFDEDCSPDQAVQDSTTIPDVDDSLLHLYAKWTAYPVYAGTYNGREVWYASNGNNTSNQKSITIDPRGNITCSDSSVNGGKIVRYDAATQYLVWKLDGNDTEYSFRYDQETGILVANNGSKTKLTHDIWVMAMGCETGETPITANMGLNYRIKDDGSFDGSTSNQYTRFLTVTLKGGSPKDILIFNDRIYTSFKITDKAGTEISFTNLYSNNAILVYVGAEKNEFLFGAATGTSSNFSSNCVIKQLDNFFGTYTADGKQVELDGVGGITYDGKTGTYAKAQAGASYTFDVYLANNTEYWRLTVNKTDMTAEIVQPTVSIVYGSEHSIHASVSANVNIEFDLPEVADTEGFVFRGWYTTADCSGDPITSYTATGSSETVTIYAKWIAKVTVTVNLNYEGAADATVYKIGSGETLTLANAKREDASFLGWFTQAEGGTQFVSDDTVVTENIELFAQWGDPCILMGTYFGGNTYSKTSGTGGSTKLEIDADGVMSGKYSGKFESYDPETQHVTFTNGSTTYHFWYHEATGVLVSAHHSTPTTAYIQNDYFTFVKGVASGNAIKTSYAIKYGYNNGTETFSDWFTRFLQVNVPTAEGGTEVKDLLIFNNHIYDNFTITNTNGNTLTIADIKDQPNIIVKVNGEWLFGVATASGTKLDGNNTTKLDEYFGEYTVADETDKVVLDGAGNITFGGKTGTYAAAEEGAGYTFEVYFKVGSVSRGEYWRLTADKTAKTATIVQPMVTVTWSTAHGETVTEQVNMNVEISDFSVPEAEGFIFRYWSEEEGGSKCWRFTPTENKTMYAVWDAAIALTLVYGNGYDTKPVYFAVGDAIDFTAIAPEETYRNEKAFMGWYTDSGCTNPVTFTTMPETAQTIYAKWVTQYFVITENTAGAGFKYDAVNEYYFTKSGKSSTASMTVTAGKSGTLTLEYLVSSEGGNYDYMTISLNGTQKIKVGGYSSEEGCAPAYDASKFVVFSIDVAANDVITISYKKDNSGDRGADTVWIRNIDLVVPDLSAEGDYTCAGQTDIHFDGIKTMIRGEETGICTAIEGQENAYDVFFMADGKPVSHYTIVLDKDANTYTITENKVQITWNVNGHGAAPQAGAFTGVALTLPTAEEMKADGFLFLGWYTNAECTGDAVTAVTPVAEGTYSYYAKWVTAFTLTIKYGNEMEDGVYTIASGETVNLNSYKPKYTNGLSFEGWYTDAGFATAVSETTFEMTANTIVHVKWEEGAAFEVESVGPNASDKVFTAYGTDGEYRTTVDGNANGNIYLAIQIYADGMLSFKWKAIDGDPEDDGVDCQFQYKVDTFTDRIFGSMSTNNNASLDSLSWNAASIDVTAGTTVYLIFNRAYAGSNAQAAVTDISLA